ncbi:thiamine biosynthesis protein MoeB [Candidatus Woesearchaeota archaeon]|nr:thiamine biosynthesis protein MoeB [Candidatus Woesearchaeota archaeon]
MEDRYSRQKLFKNIGKKGQKLLLKKSAAIVGMGALGSVCSELLARSGIGKLIIADNDKVELSNLQRQSLYSEKDAGEKKTDAAKKHLKEINSKLKIEKISKRLTEKNINDIKADIIIDGTDNMETRFLLNEYAKKNKIPFIYGSAAGSIGIVYSVIVGSPCLNCILKNAKNHATCENDGIINPATYTVASIQAVEALKILTEKTPSKEIIRFDIWKNDFFKIKVKKDADCKVCKGKYELLKGKGIPFSVSECNTKAAYSAKPKNNVKLDIKKIVSKYETVEDGKIIAVIRIDGEEIIVHNYGEILFKTLEDVKKIEEIAKDIYKTGLTK